MVEIARPVREQTRENLADLFNHGLSNEDIANMIDEGNENFEYIPTTEGLVAIIRDLMGEIDKDNSRAQDLDTLT